MALEGGWAIQRKRCMKSIMREKSAQTMTKFRLGEVLNPIMESEAKVRCNLLKSIA